MKNLNIIPFLLLVAGVALVGWGGYELVIKDSDAVAIEFVDASKLNELYAGEENRLQMKVVNSSTDTIRIVGNDAC